MQLIDLQLPNLMMNTSMRESPEGRLVSTQTGVSASIGTLTSSLASRSELAVCLGMLATAVMAARQISLVLPLVCGVLYFLQRFFLRTSRQLRLLE